MSFPYFPHEIRLEGVKGVGTIQLNLEPQQQVYCLIGTNGVGKTKLLESLLQMMIIGCVIIPVEYCYTEYTAVLSEAILDQETRIIFDKTKNSSRVLGEKNIPFQPFCFIGSQNRGLIQGQPEIAPVGTFSDRVMGHWRVIFSAINHGFSSLGMTENIGSWFVSRAMASNPYQKKEDNRQIEIETVLKLLHQIDQRVDPEFLEITGEPRVFIKIEGQKRELSQLSSGFTSILKIIQSIVSGYGYFTNEVQLQHVAGLVLIDEIESHLHNQWLVKIVPMLKQLFPNTIFIVTTHSPIVLTQLKHGEAYRLQRDDGGVVRSHLINHPDKAAFVDLLNDAFGVDLNQQKLDRISAHDQQHVKAQLLDWLSEE